MYYANYLAPMPLAPAISLPLAPGVELEMVLVRAGTFIMGYEAEGFEEEMPEYCVEITHNFYLGRYPVTQAQWAAVMGERPSYFDGPDRPVEQVSWNDIMIGRQDDDLAVSFVERINEIILQTKTALRGWRVTLPTDAQWEYAVKGGHLATRPEVWESPQADTLYPRYAGGDDENAVAWRDETSYYTTQPVGLRQPNALGLYGMWGNVYELCQNSFTAEIYQRYEKIIDINAIFSDVGSDRCVLRGGWVFIRHQTSVKTRRWGFNKEKRERGVGLRLCLTPQSHHKAAGQRTL